MFPAEVACPRPLRLPFRSGAFGAVLIVVTACFAGDPAGHGWCTSRLIARVCCWRSYPISLMKQSGWAVLQAPISA